MKKQSQARHYADFEAVREIALAFPGAAEGISHEGTPSVKVRGKLMCRMHESGAFIPIRLDIETRNAYLDSHPELFHLPDHFKPYPYLCMWIHRYDRSLLHEVLEKSWRGLASKRQTEEYDKKKSAEG